MSKNTFNSQRKLEKALDLHRNGDFNGAETGYCQVLSADPNNYTALSNVASIYLMKCEWNKAEQSLKKAFKLNASNPELSYKLGIALQRQGKLEEAIDSFKEALHKKPDYLEVYCSLGNALQYSGQPESAIECYQKALTIQPDYAEAYNNLGVTYYQKNCFDQAITAYQKALSIQPTYSEAYSNLGLVYKESGRLDEAIDCYQKAITLLPESAPAYSNLGLALEGKGQMSEAIRAYQQAIQLKPNFIEAHYNLALAYYNQGQLPEAIAASRHVIALQPDHARAHRALGLALLLTGNYTQGFPEYEWRFQASPTSSLIPDFQKWNGHLGGEHELILIEEQGIGDIIQFIRYARLLKQYFPCISIALKAPLSRLVQDTGLFHRIYLLPFQSSLIPAHAQWIHLLSVPAILGIEPGKPLINEPYLKIHADRLVYWQEKIRRTGMITVGLNWQGNPEAEKDTFKGRSFPLAEYEPLASIPNLQFVSLQKGFGSEQLEHCAFRGRFVSCQNEINDTWAWTETAAIVQNCDLIITSDTSIAHLAGALGKPVWILLTKIPDWRWGLEGEDCAWYPSARLFRQNEAGNWAEVIARMSACLAQLVLPI